jgi:hypothetical protein
MREIWFFVISRICFQQCIFQPHLNFICTLDLEVFNFREKIPCFDEARYVTTRRYITNCYMYIPFSEWRRYVTKNFFLHSVAIRGTLCNKLLHSVPRMATVCNKLLHIIPVLQFLGDGWKWKGSITFNYCTCE